MRLPPSLRLGVNIDHVATIRNARGGDHPDPLRAAEIAVRAGQLGQRGRPHGVRLDRSAGLADRGNVVDVDAESGHGSFDL